MRMRLLPSSPSDRETTCCSERDSDEDRRRRGACTKAMVASVSHRKAGTKKELDSPSLLFSSSPDIWW